ncbi:phosphoribosylformylglycinamidine synthase [Adlercreutzia sp. ZJ304]|uniref:phosphoribosylformylglycinamidine synthase n=1 Tax=Adlercreutzia sp. ZJ304 TaxID=2709791 RepID=UPI0013EB5E59|nr:phosphoribosylformylglycinamidine synthase [Adlercreutzia sp. ZJ304]
MVNRIYVEKKPGFDPHVSRLTSELRDVLGVQGLHGLRVLNRYDVEGAGDELFASSVAGVFSEPQVDFTYRTLDEANISAKAEVFAVESLPGQFDQRADSAAECMLLIGQQVRPDVRTATVYVLEGDLSADDIEAVKHYVINPVEAREAQLEPVKTLEQDFPEPADVEVLDGFLQLDEDGLAGFIAERGLAMDLADITFLQQYFREEGRSPTITEVKMVDTYWSDHCRHTTFGTQLTDFEIADANVQRAFDKYLELRRNLGREDKPVCLMDMGTIGARWLKAQGIMRGVDESEEINACTVRVKVDVDGQLQDWLYLFKNETHNHPTEIEPFGGAATCVGGAIRDPLSGRSYVYQAMRVTGASDPTAPMSDTLPGKLPQRKLCITAAEGYSSYGNQIGLATGQVNELYHPGYAAKRMEIGAVVGATPADHVRRETPAPGDVVVLLGGRTGRDGIGGATGSSKAHGLNSLENCGAEVQKGNAPVERKIQRLFRRGEACRMIKRCNDFGAGGVSVAIGELADGLQIDLDAVPLKYAGLDGTEIAISESQERMAVALASEDVEAFIGLAHEENLEATPVARVTAEPRVCMTWRGKNIVDVSREFLASNGAPKFQAVEVRKATGGSKAVLSNDKGTIKQRFCALLSDINVASNKGLAERFDSTIGAATILMPFGGATQLTPALAMVAKLPVLGGKTTTVSGLSWGFNPYLTEADPFVGSYIAVLESVAKLVATGFKRADIYLTFQEYFEKLRDEPARWGKPVAAVLGALMAQLDFHVGAIGGKDSMSGSFEQLDVPPTLVSFATAVGCVDRITSPEFKRAGSRIVLVSPKYSRDFANYIVPDAASACAVLDWVEAAIGRGEVLAASISGYGGVAEALFKMCVGNRLGVSLNNLPPIFGATSTADTLFSLAYGSFILEMDERAQVPASTDDIEINVIGTVTKAYELALPEETLNLDELQEIWESGIESVFPYRTKREETEAAEDISVISYSAGSATTYSGAAIARPHVVIPVFPGNNCEYDSAAAFERAGARATTYVINNLSPDAVRESTAELAKLIRSAQIVMLPGGFSGGDEPDGSAKFITSFFRAPAVTDAVRDLLQNRDGLMLGICNGFQALVKLGLVPYGDIRPIDADCATLTFNQIGRHQSRLVHTRVASNLSPWLAECKVGDVHTVAISHGEGRFVAPPDLLDKLVVAGQVATQYVDSCARPSMDLAVNPNGSMLAIEGITSPDGRVLGKMGHTERAGTNLYKNVPGNLYQPIFEAGVKYFQ